MKRSVGLCSSLVVGIIVAACSGSTGPAGTAGEQGKQGATGATGATGSKGSDGSGSGSETASVSAITPPYAFLGRTVDLTIAGSGTAWDASTKVTFADTNVKVNKVTVASASGLLVNVTIGANATLAATDVTVTDGTSTTVYKGAFEIKGPISVTATPTAGVPQGGLANLHIVMNDLTTPFDPNTTNATVSSMDVATSTPTPTDYAFDMTIEADVLATTGTFDVDVTSGTPTITSPGAKSFTIVARTPTTLSSTTPATGNIETVLDTSLFQFTPASAAQEFVQFSTSSAAATSQGGFVPSTVIPKSGKYADALTTYVYRYAQGTTATDPFYVVIANGEDDFGDSLTPPEDISLVAFESPCTAVSEETETAQANDDEIATAQAVAKLPALVNGTLGYGSVDATTDQDVYAITVAGATASIHAATGGDPTDDTVIQIEDGLGNVLGTSDDLDYQEDLVVSVTSSGTYYVIVTTSTADDSGGNTYQLFIDAK